MTTEGAMYLTGQPSDDVGLHGGRSRPAVGTDAAGPPGDVL